MLGEAVSVACNAILEDKPEAPPIDIEIPAYLPLLKVDPRRLHQILTHLLSNAAKFTASEGRIKVRATVAGDGSLVVTVADNGIGMDPDRIGHALQPFKQLDSRLARRFEGTGLGLPLANALVRAHDGSLSIESAPGAGTTVTVTFPQQRNVEITRAACA